MAFVKEFNAKTADLPLGTPTPVIITYYQDKSFSLEFKTAPASFLLKQAAGLPQVGLPQHLEHLFHGRRAGQQGILDLLTSYERTASSITEMTMRIYHDQPMLRRAQDFARFLRGTSPQNPKDILRARLAPLIDRVRQAVR